MITPKTILIVLLSGLILGAGSAAVMYKSTDVQALVKEVYLEPAQKCNHIAHYSTTFDSSNHQCVEKEEKTNPAITESEAKNKNTILKSGASFVTLFSVLINYLFSNPFESQVSENL